MFVKFWNYFLGWKIFSMVLIYENYSVYIFDYLLRKILKEVVKHKKSIRIRVQNTVRFDVV